MAYYTPTGNPVTLSLGSSSAIRAEFSLIQAGFNLLPTVIQAFSGSANYAVDTGVSSNTYLITVNAAIVSLTVDGLSFKFKTANANTGASTLNTISIVRPDGSALQAGDIIAGMNSVTYNSTLNKFSLDSVGSVVYATNAAASAAAASASASAASASAATAASYASALTSTSTTSLTIGTGAKVFTTQSSKGYAAGQFFSAISAANSANYMHGTVTSYVGTTLTTNVTDIGGSGTLADWNLSVSGSQGSTGANGANGWVYLSTVTASSSATADIETTFDGTYDVYALTGTLVIPATDATNLTARLKIGGTYQTAANYDYHTNITASNSAAYSASNSGSDTAINITTNVSNGASSGVNFIMYINRPSDSVSVKKVEWVGESIIAGTSLSKNASGFGGYSTSTSALTGVRFLFSSGNIASGTFRLYGLSKS